MQSSPVEIMISDSHGMTLSQHLLQIKCVAALFIKADCIVLPVIHIDESHVPDNGGHLFCSLDSFVLMIEQDEVTHKVLIDDGHGCPAIMDFKAVEPKTLVELTN